MDAALRDLEQIREKDDGLGRKLGLVGLAGLAIVGIVVGMGALLGEQTDGRADEADPLARLDRAAGLQSAEPATPVEPTRVDREALSFPTTLIDDARPEVAAALAAAGAEAEHPDPLPSVEAAPTFADTAAIAVAPPAAPPLPAAVAAGPGSRALARTAPADRLVRAVLAPRAHPTEPAAPAGREGRYTIQVISYDEAEEADAFAAALRARGHHAFVVSAEVMGRGHYYRVRIGPFEALHEAEEYRAEFERNERMNTIVVRRPDDVRQSAE